MADHASAWIADAADQRLRRMLLLASRDEALVQDVLDAAGLARDAGLETVAASLQAVASLQLGGRRGGFPPPDPADMPAGSGGPAASVDLAVAELKRLMRLEVTAQPLPAGLDTLIPSERPVGTPPPADRTALLSGLADQAAAILRELPGALAGQRAGALLAKLAVRLHALEPIRIEEQLALPIDAFADMFVLEQLRRFCLLNADLLEATGTGSLFEQAAWLDPAALGPYFTNVRLVIRSARDIFALIDAASDGAAGYAAVEGWCVLLSAHLREHELIDLIDELGDRGMKRALQSILVRFARLSSARHLYTGVRRLRDVALDIGAFDLASDAQRLLARWRRIDSNEWKLLGDILAAAGDKAAAEDAFDQALHLFSDNADARRALEMLRNGMLPKIEGGFETTAGRRQLRLARLATARTL